MFVSTEDATQKILNKKKRVEKTDHKLGITNCTESHTKKMYRKFGYQWDEREQSTVNKIRLRKHKEPVVTRQAMD